MDIFLRDPQTNVGAKVDAQGRALTAATSFSRYEQASKEGRAFNVNTGQFTINGGGEYGVLYIKNTSDKTLALEAWFISVDNYVGTSTGTPVWKAYFNPTGGTLISAGAVATPVNRNGGASETFDDITCLKASTATSTLTATTEPILLQTQGSGRAFGSIFLTLPKNASIAVTVDLKTDGSALIYQGFTGFYTQE